MLTLKSTKTRKLEKFKPLSDREVKVYYCGPTVYNYAHIGNLRAYVFEDVVIKTLRFLGYNVKTVMNITDIDDKTIRDSQVSGEKLLDFTQKYTKYFFEDIEKLNIQKADIVTPISEIIPEMVRMIQTMLRRKNAYLGEDNSIYFDIKTFKKYGNLANLDFSGMKAGVRIDNDEYDKDSAADFVLWKSWKEADGENFWEEEFEIPPSNSPLNKEGEPKKIKLKGRPGWHIECSACAMKNLGQQIDIHMGGIDNLFPHHQNEVAQTESCTHKEFAKYWLHGGHLMVEGKKMAKSAGNFYRLKDLEDRYKEIPKSILYRAIRLSFMSAKYSSQIDFSFTKLESNINVVESFSELFKKLKREIEVNTNSSLPSADFRETLQDYMHAYISSLEDDFNIPESLAVLHNFTKFVNTGLSEKLFSISEIESIIDFYKTFDEVLSIFDFSVLSEKEEEFSEEIQKLFEERNTAKQEKNFEKADKLRDELLEKGYKIVDNRDGSFLEKV